MEFTLLDFTVENIFQYKTKNCMEAWVSLAIPTPETGARYVVGAIHLPPTFPVTACLKKKPSHKGKKIPKHYKECNFAIQREVLLKVAAKTVTPFLHAGVIAFGLSQNGMLHMHFAGYAESVQTHFDLASLRQDVLSTVIMTAMKVKKNTMAHVYFLTYNDRTPQEMCDYLQKNTKEHDGKLGVFIFDRIENKLFKKV